MPISEFIYFYYSLFVWFPSIEEQQQHIKVAYLQQQKKHQVDSEIGDRKSYEAETRLETHRTQGHLK